MKRLVKRFLKAIWRSTEPLRRPILFKLEQFIRRCLQPTEPDQVTESDVLMDHVVRELIRLQGQVEAVQQTLLELSSTTHGDAAIAGGIEPDAATPGERLKAG
jgi:hypothetical protein